MDEGEKRLAGDILVALAAGIIASNIFTATYAAVFGVSFLAHVDLVYLKLSSYFAQHQPPLMIAGAVLILLKLAPLVPIAVGALLWWTFGRPALRWVLRRSACRRSLRQGRPGP